MGLEPTGAMGFRQCDASGDDYCGPADGHNNDSHSVVVYVILFGWRLVMTALMIAASVMAWRRIRALEVNAGHLALQVAEADTTSGDHMRAIPQVNQSIAQLREQAAERVQHLDMTSDSVQGIHYGLVQLGGFVQYNDLTPAQRRSMYEIECGNIVALNAMGQQQYLSTIRQQARGYVRAGDDTDGNDMDDGESMEEEHAEHDSPVFHTNHLNNCTCYIAPHRVPFDAANFIPFLRPFTHLMKLTERMGNFMVRFKSQGDIILAQSIVKAR
eukprot:s1037_g13.t1